MTDAAATKAESTAISAAKPSWVQQFVARAHGEINKAPAATPISYVRETGSMLGEFTEGGVTGSLLGATLAMWGLDSKAGPVDGMLAGFGAIMSVALSGHFPGAAAHFRKVGAQAFTVLAFRKGYEVVKHEPLMGGMAPGVHRIAAPGGGPGVSKEDPIEVAARGLDAA